MSSLMDRVDATLRNIDATIAVAEKSAEHTRTLLTPATDPEPTPEGTRPRRTAAVQWFIDCVDSMKFPRGGIQYPVVGVSHPVSAEHPPADVND